MPGPNVDTTYRQLSRLPNAEAGCLTSDADYVTAGLTGCINNTGAGCLTAG
jgi:hypothetical protein